MNPRTQGEGCGSRHIGPAEGGRKNCLAGVAQIGIESLIYMQLVKQNITSSWQA